MSQVAAPMPIQALQQIQPLGGQTPRSQYLADALKGMGGGGAPDVNTPTDLGMALMADALRNQAQQNPTPADYKAKLAAAGIDPTLDPGAGPRGGLGGLYDNLQRLPGLLGLGGGSSGS